jgi:hypothetical protein
MTCDPHSIPFFFNIDVRLESHLCCCFFYVGINCPKKTLCMCICIYVHIYIYIHTYVYMCHIYIYIYLFTHISYMLCVCMYIYILCHIYIYQVPKNWSIFWVWTGIPTWPIANYHWGSYLVIPLYIHIYIYMPLQTLLLTLYIPIWFPYIGKRMTWLDP